VSMASKRNLILAAMVALLLFAAWLRLRSWVDFVEWPDEVWSVWHVRGTLHDALLRTPYDWPPLFTLTSWLWVQIAGAKLEASRYLMILVSLVGVACAYRAAREGLDALTPSPSPSGRGEQETPKQQPLLPPLIAALVYAVTGFALFTSIEVRAYAVLYTLGALTMWLMLRWLKRPTLGRSIPLAVTLALMLYTSYTAVAFGIYLALFALWMKPKFFMRWLGMGLAVLVLVVPIAPGFLNASAGRVNIPAGALLPFSEQMLLIYRQFGGQTAFWIPLIAAMIALAVAFVRRPDSRRLIVGLLGWVLAPAAAYVALRYREYVSPRYLWWVLLGLALFIGAAAVYLPRYLRWAATAFLVVMAIFPVDFNDYRIGIRSAAPMRAMMDWLADRIHPGDVVVIDPNCDCGEPHVWDYFLPQYFPGGLPIVTQPGDAARVWYLSEDGAQDPALLNAVNAGRNVGEFVGPWYFLLRLYEGAPLVEGADFGGRVSLRGAEMIGNRRAFAEGEALTVRLWWAAVEPLDADYSFSLALIDNRGNIVAQADGPAPIPSSQWEVGKAYPDSRSLTIPTGLDFITDYRLVVTVYQWWDGVRLRPAANDLWDTTSDDYLVLQTVTVKAW